MERPLLAHHARARHPDAATLVATDLARKAAQAKRPPVDPHAIAWFYSWAVGRDGYHLSLQGTIGKSRSAARLATIAHLADTPPEVQQAYQRPKASVGHTPHAATIEVDGATWLVLGAYQRQGKAPNVLRLLCLTVGEDVDAYGALYTLDNDGLWFAGGFQPKAAQAYTEAGEGGVWRYRNTPFQRLTAAEIRAVLPAKARFAGVDSGRARPTQP